MYFTGALYTPYRGRDGGIDDDTSSKIIRRERDEDEGLKGIKQYKAFLGNAYADQIQHHDYLSLAMANPKSLFFQKVGEHFYK